MNGLKKRKGVTLTEVIISLIILSVIIAAVMTFLSSGYSNILGARKLNKENYAIQAYFEEEMAKAKRDGANGSDYVEFKYKIGNASPQTITVQGKKIGYPRNKLEVRTGSKIQLFVSNEKEAVLDLPDDLRAVLGNEDKLYYYVGDRMTSGKLLFSSDIINNIKIETRESWLLSRRAIGNNGVVPVGSLVAIENRREEFGITFPNMSNTTTDVSELGTDEFSTLGFTITDDMRAKYLTFGGRAINTYGRVGSYVSAQPVWIMGIPIVNGLTVHTDVDLVTTEDNGPIPQGDKPYTNTIVKDYRSGYRYSGKVPVLSVFEEELGQSRQFITFGGGHDGRYFSNRNLESHTTAVLIGNKKQSGQLLTYEAGSMKWSLNLAEDGGVSVNFTDSTGLNRSIPAVESLGTINYDKDHSFQVRTAKVSGRSELKLELFIDGKLVDDWNITYSRTGSTSVNQARVYYGGDTYINELAMYNRNLEDSEIAELTEYFEGKYKTTYNAN